MKIGKQLTIMKKTTYILLSVLVLLSCNKEKMQQDAHETVGSGMPVLQLIGQGRTEVIINIPASENLRSSQFASFSARFDVLPGEQFPLQLPGFVDKR